METNATVTIKRRGDSYNQTTGRRATTTQESLLTDAPCVFSQPKGSNRQRYQSGQRDITQPVYSLLIPQVGATDIAGITISPGDEATVTVTIGASTITQVFSIADAIPAAGYTEFHWECTIERIKHATP